MQRANEAMGPSPEERQETELLRHAAWIRRLALGLVGDAALAEDLVQDTWLAALRRRPSTDAPLEPWLRTVLRNAARQAFRGGARRSARQAEARGPTPTPGPEELAERLEMERRLTDELARLEEPLRSTLLLRYYEGLEPSEIARLQGLPPGTVRWRVKRGLERLRERLDDRFGGRSAWGVLALSLARPNPGAPWAGAGTAAATLPGALAMHAFTKIGIGAAAALALAAGLRLGGAWPDALWPVGDEEPARVAMRPLAPKLAPAETPRPEPRSAPAARREALEPAALPDAAPAHAAAEAVSAVEARAVDELGAPIAGARLRLVDGPPVTAESGRDGVLHLEIPSGRPGASARLAVGAQGFATRGFETVIESGATTHLGTIELAPGGAVSGVVRDASGRSLADVELSIGDVGVPRAQLDGMRLQPPEEFVPSARTRPDGTFLVEGVPTGTVRVWARHEGFLAAYTAPVEVRAGQESYGLELVLQTLSPENRIAGVVLDPTNAPVPGALLSYRHSSKANGVTQAGEKEADERGRFEFLVPGDTELWITARDPEERFGPGSASGVRTASGELVVRLTSAEHFALAVVDEAGAPVTTYGALVLSRDGEFERQSLPRGEHEDGASSLRLPAEAFRLRVDAPGFELADVGPFEPATLSDPLVVALAPVPGLRGRVRIGSGPAAGARVSLLTLVPPGHRTVKNGFRTLVESGGESVQTDADGRFLLTPRAPGRYVVRAERGGFAPAVSGTLEIGASLFAPEVELELTAGGRLEGRVVQLDGSDPAGTIVGLSRGDGEDRTLRVGPEGAYRFEHLTPGPWLLIACEEEIQPGRTVTTSTDRPRGPEEIEWTCRVEAGRTTHHDLVLGDEETCVLTGRFRIDGSAPSAWGAALLEGDDVFDLESAERVALAPDGSFRLTMPEPGRYWLALTGGAEEGREQFVLDAVHLGLGTTAWDLDLETGTLVVDGVPAWDGDGFPPRVHVWDGPGKKKAFTIVAGDASGHATLASIPAGKGRIVRPDPTTSDFDRWPTVREIEVPRAGELRVRLP